MRARKARMGKVAGENGRGGGFFVCSESDCAVLIWGKNCLIPCWCLRTGKAKVSVASPLKNV